MRTPEAKWKHPRTITYDLPTIWNQLILLSIAILGSGYTKTDSKSISARTDNYFRKSKTMAKSTTLKTRFSLSMVLVYLFLGSITFIAIHFSSQRIINSLGARFAVKQALLEKSKLMSQIQQDLTLSLKMAHSPLLEDWIENENDSELKHRAMEELESYRTSFKDKSLFVAIDRSGNYYFADDASDFSKPRYTLNKENTNDAWFYRTLRDVDSFELNIDYDNHLNLNKIWYNVVIRNRQQRKVGLCGSAMDITQFISQIINSDDPGIQTILFSTGGTIEGHKDHNYVIHNSKVRGNEKKITIYDLIESPKDKTAIKKAVDRLTRGISNVENLSVTLQGKSYIAAISYMNKIRWYNLVLVDAQEVVGSRSFIAYLTISILALLLVVVIVIVLLNRLVLRPLSVLSTSAKQMAAGNFDISIPVESKDEIGALTHSFNEMAAMVKDHSENLEHKVTQRTEELHLSTQMLSESNKKIMASIRYAQLIQTSMLPLEKSFHVHLGNFFILYQPREIVGGDFYFFRELDGGFIIAVVDCTGHGVPGALMTMTANAVLSTIIDSLGIHNPADILDTLNKRFHTSQHQNGGEERIDYGLDVGLCMYRKATNELLFSGAGIDLHCVADGRVEVIKGDRTSLGYRRSGMELHFRNSTVNVATGMQFYLTSDGILDQSGGPKGWGFGRKRFIDLIKTIAELPSSVQLQRMQEELSAYRGENPQRDDITAMGFSIPPQSPKNNK